MIGSVDDNNRDKLIAAIGLSTGKGMTRSCKGQTWNNTSKLREFVNILSCCIILIQTVNFTKESHYTWQVQVFEY